jgi:hypothetical protein
MVMVELQSEWCAWLPKCGMMSDPEIRINFLRVLTSLRDDDVDDNSRTNSQISGNEETMTSGPPPSAASSSKSTNAASTTSTLPSQQQNFGSLSSSPLNATLPQKYYREGAWNVPLPPRYYGYPSINTTSPVAYPTGGPTMTSFSSGHIYGSGTKFNPPSSARTNVTTPARPLTPPPPDPETFKHWDEVIKKFLVKTKMCQTLKGLESDMLVLSPDWEQETIPEALKEMVQGLQVRLFFSLAVCELTCFTRLSWTVCLEKRHWKKMTWILAAQM